MTGKVGFLFLGLCLVLWGNADAVNHQVSIIDFSFSPNILTINFGDSVTWTNNGNLTHTTTSNDGIWNSGDLLHLQSYSFVLDTSGTFSYHCIHHPSMIGTITVNPAPFDIQVYIGDDFFSPQVIQIDPGQSIGWVNRGMHLHTSTSLDNLWDSGIISPGQFFSFSFLAEGVHHYYCTVHGQTMNGTVIVGKPDSVMLDIDIVDFAFSPVDTALSLGQNVRWINFGSMVHTTTDTTANRWDSGNMNPGDVYTLHADSAGVFHYICVYHLGSMFGTLTVTDTTSPGGCSYVAGDGNGNGTTNGIDVVYLVNYFKGGPEPPVQCDCPGHGLFFAGADANGNCVVNGIDVSYLVNYFKGGPGLHICADCPPTP